MNTSDQWLERANEYVDGELSEEDARKFEEELGRSEELRTSVEGLRGLRARARALSGAVEPPRDLWPAVARSIESRANHPVSLVDRIGLRTGAAALAAAAALVVFVMTGPDAEPTKAGPLAVAPVESLPEQQAPVEAPDRAAEAGPLTPQEQEYVAAIESLSSVFASQRNHMSVATLATFEANLRIVDTAIASARDALASEPDRRDLVILLDDVYLQKIDLLREATELQEWMS